MDHHGIAAPTAPLEDDNYNEFISSGGCYHGVTDDEAVSKDGNIDQVPGNSVGWPCVIEDPEKAWS